jgi:hypothetical protein
MSRPTKTGTISEPATPNPIAFQPSLMHLRRAAVLAGYFLFINPDAAADPLDPYRWKSRLIMASVTTGEARVQLTAALAANRAAIDERDLIVVDVSPESARLPGTVRLDPKQTTALRERLKLSARETNAVFILIGKDGGEKARQRGPLKLANWFTLIDGMPMRRDEIRRQGKSRE